MLPKTIEVPFHGDTLLTVEQDGQPYVAIKPICERLGLSWQPQHRKLTEPNSDWTITNLVMVGFSADGRLREMTCLALFDFPLWLSTISPNRVADDLREVLKRYRREAKQVLFDHFITRQQKAEASLQASHTHLLAQYPRWAKLVTLINGGSTEFLVYKRSNMTQKQFEAELQEMERCGLLNPERFITNNQETLLEERNRLRVEKMGLQWQLQGLEAKANG